MRILLLALMLFVTSVSNAQTIDFEDAPQNAECEWSGGALYTNYRGLTWTGFRPLNITNYNMVCNPWHGSGYESLPTSLNEFVALGFGPSEIRSESPFTLNSFQYGTGWNNGQLLVEGWDGDNWFTMNQLGLAVNTTGLFTTNTELRGLRFTPTWEPGTQFKGADFGGTPYNTFYVDNINVSTVPEPSTYALMATGLAGLFYSRRRKAKLNC
jgi:hypothetical protein